MRSWLTRFWNWLKPVEVQRPYPVSILPGGIRLGIDSTVPIGFARMIETDEQGNELRTWDFPMGASGGLGRITCTPGVSIDTKVEQTDL